MSDALLSVRPSFGSWNRGLLHIEYGLGVLEEIRRTVQEGFHKIPHGGVETGGLLYGKWDEKTLTISAWRPMQCEHPSGPRFLLSPADEIALEAQLSAQLSGEVAGLEDHQVVGWFASHSRGALQLRGPDLELHNKFFPEPWHSILLLCASRSQPMVAAFYTRVEGTLAIGAEVSPFEVIPNPMAVPRRAGRAHSGLGKDGRPKQDPGNAISILATQLGSEPVTMIEPGGAKEVPTGAWAPLEPAATSPWAARSYSAERPPTDVARGNTEATQQAGRAPLDGAETGLAYEEDSPKFTAPVELELPFRWKRLGWALAWLAIAGGGVYAIPRLAHAPAGPPVLEVQVNEVDNAPPGQVMIRWDLKGGTQAPSQGGEIRVTEGTGANRAQQTFTLSPADSLAGALTYWRRTDNVDVEVAVRTDAGTSGDPVIGKARFSREGTSPASNAQLKLLREQLRVQRNRGVELERQLALKQRKQKR